MLRNRIPGQMPWFTSPLSRDQPCHSGALQTKAGFLVRLDSELSKTGAEPLSLLMFCQPLVMWAQKPQASHTNRACISWENSSPAFPVQMWNQVQTGADRVIFVSRTLTDPAGRELLKGSNWEGRRKSAGVRNRPGWKWETSVSVF